MSPLLADIVAKVPKGAAANFPPNNKTSNNRRSIGLQTCYQTRLCVLRLATWCPASLFNRCTYGSENLSPTSQKDFCNNIGTFRTCHRVFRMSAIGGQTDSGISTLRRLGPKCCALNQGPQQFIGVCFDDSTDLDKFHDVDAPFAAFVFGNEGLRSMKAVPIVN